MEIAGFVRDGGCWRACCTRCVGFDVNGNQLSIGIDEVLVLGVGVLLDFHIKTDTTSTSNTPVKHKV